MDKNEIKLRIIRRLVKWRKWGSSHTENIIGGLPSHLKGSKMVKEIIKELEKDEWIIPKIKTNEIHYSLNVEKADEILEFYEKYS
jgi:hypothetical protein